LQPFLLDDDGVAFVRQAASRAADIKISSFFGDSPNDVYGLNPEYFLFSRSVAMNDCVSCFQQAKPMGAPASRPRSACLVGKVGWAWSPANNRFDVYYLSTDRNRSRWYLWLSDPSVPGFEINEIVAFRPYLHAKRVLAAVSLLSAFFREDDLNQEIGLPTEVYPGLLSVEAIMSIARLSLSE
jgi:hypothetical protein